MTATSAAHPAHGAQGFLLLTLNNVEALLPNTSGRIVDQLALECVTLPDPDDAERDVWLILRVGSNEMAIAPTQVVRHARSARTFVFEGGVSGVGADAKWALKLPEPSSPGDVEDLETFEVILAQYAAVEEVDMDGPPPDYTYSGAQYPTPFDASVLQVKRPVPPPPAQSRSEKPPLPPRSIPDSDLKDQKIEDGLRGRLVLVDEDDGEIVGTLNEQFSIHEDEALLKKGHEKDPVIIDIPEGGGGKSRATEVYVHPVPIEQQDRLMKTASIISRGLVYATDAVTIGMGAASSFYISHSTPNEKPLEFSERTRGHVRRVHNISGKAVVVTAKTTGLIHEALGRAVDYVSSNNEKGKGTSKAPPAAIPGGTPPPLPLKNRILLSTDMLLTTVENSAKQLIEHGTVRMSEALGHKYGKDMGDASYLMGQSARNVGIVYIDARGVGRRALIKSAGKRYIKAKLGKKDVVLGLDEKGALQENTQINTSSSSTTSTSDASLLEIRELEKKNV